VCVCVCPFMSIKALTVETVVYCTTELIYIEHVLMCPQREHLWHLARLLSPGEHTDVTLVGPDVRICFILWTQQQASFKASCQNIVPACCCAVVIQCVSFITAVSIVAIMGGTYRYRLPMY
jgi:hypothetical protein